MFIFAWIPPPPFFIIIIIISSSFFFWNILEGKSVDSIIFIIFPFSFFSVSLFPCTWRGSFHCLTFLCKWCVHAWSRKEDAHGIFISIHNKPLYISLTMPCLKTIDKLLYWGLGNDSLNVKYWYGYSTISIFFKDEDIYFFPRERYIISYITSPADRDPDISSYHTIMYFFFLHIGFSFFLLIKFLMTLFNFPRVLCGNGDYSETFPRSCFSKTFSVCDDERDSS